MNARTSRRTHTSIAGLGLLLALVTASCIDERITVRFDAQSVGNPVNPVNEGSVGDYTNIEVMSINGGEIIGAPGVTGNGSAGEYPAHSIGPDSPRAVIKITNLANSNLHLLNPAERDFWFGADVNLDTVNATPGSNDDGNNVIQRGLYNETSQFKIEVDRLRPSCRIKGSLDDIRLEGNPITPEETYRIRCERIGATIRLMVWPVNADGSLGSAVTNTAQVIDVGPLVFDRGIPMSIGGKLNNNGTVNASTDQFNGTIDNAILRIDFPEFEDPAE